MSELDEASGSAAEIFGAEALRDERSLKRAYAKLIRQFGPEADPLAFRRIRAAYEAAREALRAQGSSEPLATAPTAPVASDGVDAIFAKLSEQEWESSLGALRALALEGDAAAAALALTMEWVSGPGAAMGFLSELSARRVGDHVFGGLIELVAREPVAARESACAEILSACVERPHFVEALVLCIDARLSTDDAPGAAALFRAHGERLRTVAPSAWAHAAEGLLVEGAAQLSAQELDAILDAADAASSGVDDATFWILTRRVCDELSLRAAQDDPRVPAELLAALRFTIAAPPLLVFRGLYDAAAILSEPLSGMDRYPNQLVYLQTAHPGLARLLADALANVSGSRPYLVRWQNSGEVPPLSLPALERALDVLHLPKVTPEQALPSRYDPTQIAPVLCALVGFAAILWHVAQRAAGMHMSAPGMLFVFALVVGVGAKIVGADRQAKKLVEDDTPSRAESFGSLQVAQQATGAWAHELAAASLSLWPDQRSTIAAYTEQNDVDLRALHDNHLKRLIAQARGEAVES